MTARESATSKRFLRPLLVVSTLLLTLILGATSANAATGWSPRETVSPSADCFSVELAIDAAGRPHVLAQCGDDIRYWVKTGATWTTSPIATQGFNADPQLAIDGHTLYAVYSHEPLAGCGDQSDVAGVYYRTRALPNGAWSTARRIGSVKDRLLSFRAVGGALHATVVSRVGRTVYETTLTGVLKRYAIPGATGAASLRVGNDGRARIAYEATNSLRYALFTGSTFQWSTIPGTTDRDGAPVLVLDAHDRAHVVWQHTVRFEPGCVIPEDHTAADGTYYATNASGSWTPAAARRITRNLGATSLTVDTKSGVPHIVVATTNGLKYYTKSAAGSWSGVTISTLPPSDAAIRLDQARGRLVTVFTSLTSGRLYALTKP